MERGVAHHEHRSVAQFYADYRKLKKHLRNGPVCNLRAEGGGAHVLYFPLEFEFEGENVRVLCACVYVTTGEVVCVRAVAAARGPVAR